MEPLKKYLVANFEQLFVLIILISIAAIMAFVPFKLAFLNFFFLPVLLAAYYLDSRTSLLSTIFTVISVILAAVIYPDLFKPIDSPYYLFSNLLSWACFLLLTALIVGYLHRNLLNRINQITQVTAELTGNKTLLRKTTAELEDYVHHLDEKVDKRTESLEKNNLAVEEHKQKVEDALFATMDPVVAKMLIEKRLRTEHRRISVQFCDIKNFTTYSERNPAEVVVNKLNKHLEDMENNLLCYKGHIDKYLGDGIMTEFGAPNHYDQHALMAVISALKIQESLRENDSTWELRIGISTGDAITGLVGSKRQSYTALGDTVNLASRIQELCVPGSVTVDEATEKDTARFIQYQRKTNVQPASAKTTENHQQFAGILKELDHHAANAELLIKAADYYLQLNDTSSSQVLLKRVLSANPDHDEAKLLYAEASLKMDGQDDISIRGRKQSVHLYEARGIINPLDNREKIPEYLYDAYIRVVTESLVYPENIVLPVECIEGSVGHSRVVGFLAYAIADSMNLPDQEKLDVLEAGYLADIGKSIIPHHLLNRRGTLSAEEFESIHKHPRESVRKLKQMGYESANLFEIIQNHHENCDGSGYPEGKVRADISMGARIVAVAEAYDSITSWRPYRESWDRLAAIDELQRYTTSGKFDPIAMEHLHRLLTSSDDQVTATPSLSRASYPR